MIKLMRKIMFPINDISLKLRINSSLQPLQPKQALQSRFLVDRKEEITPRVFLASGNQMDF